MMAQKILREWKINAFKPIYWLEGDEPYYIDILMDYAEKKILSEAEASFNLTVFYGKDADWAQVVNACRRYPMFAERQVVLLKEAQQMKDIEKLQGYIENPLATTVFVVSHKEKKLDARGKLGKKLKDSKLAEVFTTKKLYDNQLPEWASNIVKEHGLTINPKALQMLVEHIGNDLSRIEKEVEKIMLNLGAKKSISEDDVEKYIGVSKEYNVFELQSAIAQKNMSKSMKIIQYFEANPKAGPIQLLLPSVYNFFSKLYMLKAMQGVDDKSVAAAIGVNPYFIKEYISAASKYDYASVEKVLLLLHQYNLRKVGINDGGTSDAGLMKEFVVKVMN